MHLLAVRCKTWSLSTQIRFQTKTELFCSVFKNICVHTYRSRIVFARPHYNAVSVFKKKRFLTLSAHAQERSHMVASVRHFGYSRSSGLAPGRFYFNDVNSFQIASFSPSTIESCVFKRHRFQLAPPWRAFSNGSVFGDRFRRCGVDDSRIRSKTAPFSFENGLVWTRALTVKWPKRTWPTTDNF